MSVYAVALGGPDLRTLYLCAAPTILAYQPATERQACMLACEISTPGA